MWSSNKSSSVYKNMIFETWGTMVTVLKNDTAQHSWSVENYYCSFDKSHISSDWRYLAMVKILWSFLAIWKEIHIFHFKQEPVVNLQVKLNHNKSKYHIYITIRWTDGVKEGPHLQNLFWEIEIFSKFDQNVKMINFTVASLFRILKNMK